MSTSIQESGEREAHQVGCRFTMIRIGLLLLILTITTILQHDVLIVLKCVHLTLDGEWRRETVACFTKGGCRKSQKFDDISRF